MSRGGRFDTVDESWKDDHIKAAYKFPVQIWHEGLAKMRHSMTGERYAAPPGSRRALPMAPACASTTLSPSGR